MQVTCQDSERGQQEALAAEAWHGSLGPGRICMTVQVSGFRSAECGAVYQVNSQAQRPRQRLSLWTWDLRSGIWE